MAIADGQTGPIDPNAMMSDAIGNPAGQVADQGIGSPLDISTPSTDMTDDQIAPPTTQVEQSLDPNCDPSNPSSCQDPVADANAAVSEVSAAPSQQEFSEPIGCTNNNEPGCSAPSEEILVNGEPVTDDNTNNNNPTNPTDNGGNNDSNPDGDNKNKLEDQGVKSWVWWVIALGIVGIIGVGVFCKRQMEISKQIERAERHQAHGQVHNGRSGRSNHEQEMTTYDRPGM